MTDGGPRSTERRRVSDIATYEAVLGGIREAALRARCLFAELPDESSFYLTTPRQAVRLCGLAA